MPSELNNDIHILEKDPIIYGFGSAGYAGYANKENKHSVLTGLPLMKKIRYSHKNTTPPNYYNCKSHLVDLMVHNLGQFLQGKPIRPLYFVLQSNHFSPDINRISLRTFKDGITAAELRTIYKLLHEFPDETITKVAKAIFYFKEYDIPSGKLNDIQAPWENNSQLKKNISTDVKSNKPSTEPNYTRTAWHLREDYPSIVNAILESFTSLKINKKLEKISELISKTQFQLGKGIGHFISVGGDIITTREGKQRKVPHHIALIWRILDNNSFDEEKKLTKIKSIVEKIPDSRFRPNMVSDFYNMLKSELNETPPELKKSFNKSSH